MPGEKIRIWDVRGPRPHEFPFTDRIGTLLTTAQYDYLMTQVGTVPKQWQAPRKGKSALIPEETTNLFAGTVGPRTWSRATNPGLCRAFQPPHAQNRAQVEDQRVRPEARKVSPELHRPISRNARTRPKSAVPSMRAAKMMAAV